MKQRTLFISYKSLQRAALKVKQNKNFQEKMKERERERGKQCCQTIYNCKIVKNCFKNGAF
jgi:hypothetical protein